MVSRSLDRRTDKLRLRRRSLFDGEAQAAEGSQTPEPQTEPDVSGSEEEIAISAAETNASQPSGAQEQTAFTYPD